MDRIQARDIATHLTQLGNRLGARYALKAHHPEQVLKDWHARADGLQSEGAFLFEDGSGKRLWVLLLDWPSANNFYVMLFPEEKGHPLAEIHKWTDLDGEPGLTWHYKPSKRDGLNDKRIAYFIAAFMSRDVCISVPASAEEAQGFLDELFALAESREKADRLAPDHPPVRDSFPEGKLKQKLHLARERNQSVIRLAKQNGMDAEGRVRCACCKLDFFEMYGIEGKGFIEGHHTKPVSTLHKDGGTTRIEDIALVCANCHRMLHRKRPWLEMHELSKLLEDNR